MANEDYICLGYIKNACPNRCSWNDCDAFKPSSYMKAFMKQCKEDKDES